MHLKRMLSALLVAGAAGALPSLAAPAPHVVDPAGDAGPLTVYSNAQGGVGSVDAYDIRSVTFAAGTVPDTFTASLQLTAPPTDVGYYVVSFDVPGCAGGTPSPTLDSPRPEPEGKRTYRAFRLIYSHLAGPVGDTTIADCVAAGPNKNTTYPITSTVSGSTITFTVPSNALVKPGVKLTGPMAVTATGGTGVVDTFMDMAGPGRDYVVTKAAAPKPGKAPVAKPGTVADPPGDAPVAGLDIVNAQLTTRVVKKSKELVATLTLAGSAVQDGTYYRMSFNLPGCANATGTGVLLTYDGLRTRAASSAYLICTVTNVTIQGTVVFDGSTVELSVPYGGLVTAGAKAVGIRGGTLLGPREVDLTDVAADYVLR